MLARHFFNNKTRHCAPPCIFKVRVKQQPFLPQAKRKNTIMKIDERKARVKSTGQEIKVYKHREGGWVNSFDLDTKYSKEEIELL